jgi:hypothetical protein
MAEVSSLGPTMAMISAGIKTASESVEKYQTQLSTNQKEMEYSGLGDKASLYSTLESLLKAKEAEIDNALFIGPDFLIAQNSIESIRKYAEEFSTLVNQAKQNELPGFDYQKSAKSTLNLVRDILNTRTSERYVCGGSVVNELPVDLTLLPDPATYNLDDTDDVPIDPNNPQSKPAYYKGDNNLQQLQIDNQSLDIAFTANELGPQRLIRALHILSSADPSAGDYKQKVDEAARVAKLAVNDLRNMEARLGSTGNSIKEAKTHIASQNLGFSKQIQDINGIDKNQSAIKAMSAVNLVNVNNQIATQMMRSSERACNMFLGVSGG